MESVFKSVDERSARMRSDSVKNMSAYADQNHASSLAAARLELITIDELIKQASIKMLCSCIFILACFVSSFLMQ